MGFENVCSISQESYSIHIHFCIYLIIILTLTAMMELFFRFHLKRKNIMSENVLCLSCNCILVFYFNIISKFLAATFPHV